MNEKQEIYERKNFWKWLAIISLIFAVLFGIGMCSPLYHTKHKIPNYLEKGNENIHDQDQGYDYKDDEKSQNLLGSEKKTSNYRINLPYNRYLVTRPISLHNLAKRWHCSTDDIIISNPDIKFPSNPSTPVKPDKPINVPDESNMQGWEKEVFDLTNKERTKAGKPALKGTYTELNNSSHAKSKEMVDKNYFSHTSPTYGDPFSFMKAYNVKYSAAGENIAQGQRTPEEVVQAWMNSAGHRANILGDFDYMGVGFVKGNDKFAWTQQFVKE